MDQLNREQLLESFEYLDNLRESGRTNMYGSAQYVQHELGYDRGEARNVVSLWMKTFDGESTVEQRVNGLMEEV